METYGVTPDIGKRVLTEHQNELEQGLRLLASVLTPCAETDLSGFFHDFFDGIWNPFEEVCKHAHVRQQDISAEILALERQLKKAMPPELLSVFTKHDDLTVQRNTTELDLAFLIGFQSAIRFLMMGLFPAAKIFPREEDSE